jgi:hypothetical protein
MCEKTMIPMIEEKKVNTLFCTQKPYNETGQCSGTVFMSGWNDMC